MDDDADKIIEGSGDDAGTPPAGQRKQIGGQGEVSPCSEPVADQIPDSFSVDAQGMSRADLVLIQSALRKHFKIPDGFYSAMPALVAQMITDGDAGHRIKLSAMRLGLNLMRHGIKQLETLHDLGILNPTEEEVTLIRTPLAGPDDADMIGPVDLDDEDDEDDEDDDAAVDA